jgi:4-hydroxy-3-polyprenylbenzoate decarboxylase
VTDLREWIAEVAALGQLVEVRGARCEDEIGPITRLYMARPGNPALLFREIPGYAPDVRILTNVNTSQERVALSLRLPAGLSSQALVERWRDFARGYRPIPHVTATDGPVLTHSLEGDRVDLRRFPAPRWHERDGSDYLGTGSLVVIRDPDSDWINAGCYRVAVHDERTAGLLISPSHHGRTLLERHWRRGQPCPVAVSLGHDPLLYLIGGINVPAGVCEYDVAGAVQGRAVETVRAPVTGLPVPARAEVVLEGFVPPDERREEGPFGEWTGYYAAGRRPQPVIRVKAIHYRPSPIIVGAIPGAPPSDNTYYFSFLTAAEVWNQLELAGVAGVRGVWAHESGGGRMWITIAIEQLYPGHSRQAGLIASQCLAGAYANRWVVVVDEDIDPRDTDAVLWAMCTRVDPREDVTVLTRCLSSALDPMAYPEQEPMYNARVVVDACRPWHRRHTFPPAVTMSPAVQQRILEKFPELFQAITRDGLPPPRVGEDESVPARTGRRPPARPRGRPSAPRQ